MTFLNCVFLFHRQGGTNSHLKVHLCLGEVPHLLWSISYISGTILDGGVYRDIKLQYLPYGSYTLVVRRDTDLVSC